MIKKLAPILISLAVVLALIFLWKPTTQTYDNGGKTKITFGTVSFPTSLDTTTNLPNPSATDSVATVSHSALHTNENLGIIALETKLGITASTPVANSVFQGSGLGSSIWSTFLNISGISATTASTTNFLATGSSTLQNLTFQNATGTQATTTSLYVSSTASTTNLNANIASLGALTVGSCVGCSSNSSVSTTSAQVLATTTLSGIPAGNILNFLFHSTSSVAIKTGLIVPNIDTQVDITFNTYGSTANYIFTGHALSGNSVSSANTGVTSNQMRASSQGAGQGTEVLIKGTIMNVVGFWKNGFIDISYTSNAGSVYHEFLNFLYKDTTAITSITFSSASSTNGFSTSTYISTF